MPLRLVFMGTPDFAVPTLRALAAQGHEIAAVYSRAAKPAGRGMAARETPVAREAARLKLPLLTPATLKTPEAQAEFRGHGAQAAVVVAYGLILPRAILEAAPAGCFNVHASLLPRWRGAAPIHRAIMAGDAHSGITVMKMDEGLDTGAMALTAPLAIAPDMTTGDLHDALAVIGSDLMARALEALERGTLPLTAQPQDGVTYAAKIDKNETRIDWSQPAQAVHNHIRALSPFPGAWFALPDDKTRVKVLRSTLVPGASHRPGTVLDDALTIACGEGAVRLLQVQRAGKQPMAAADFLRGTALAPHSVLG